MTTWLKRSALALLSLLVVAAAAIALAAQLGERKMRRHIDVQVTPVALTSDAASIERGSYLFRTRGCADCHGADGAGREMVKSPDGLWIHAPNLTSGPGGVVSGYTSVDWPRTLRHGVKPDGRPVIVMPSEDFARLTDADVAALAAYVRQLPAKPGESGHIAYPLPMRVLYAIGAIPDAAERIDHSRTPSQPVPEGVTDAHGAYVAAGCVGCHGEHLSGGRIAGGPPSWPAAANLTPGEGSALARYPDAQALIGMFRTGKRPDGSKVSGVMPFAALKEFTDIDVQALYLHLSALPPRAAGQH